MSINDDWLDRTSNCPFEKLRCKLILDYFFHIEDLDEPKIITDQNTTVSKQERKALLTLFGEGGAQALEAWSYIIGKNEDLGWIRQYLFGKLEEVWGEWLGSRCSPELSRYKLILDQFFQVTYAD